MGTIPPQEPLNVARVVEVGDTAMAGGKGLMFHMQKEPPSSAAGFAAEEHGCHCLETGVHPS